MDRLAKWVQIISQTVTTITAVVTAILAYQTFIKPPTQESIKSIGGIPELVIFTTSSQVTTLRATASGLRCYLEDKDDGEEALQWTISPAAAKKVIATEDISFSEYRGAVGKVSIGAKKNWFYSKRLHPDEEIFKADLISLLKQIP